MPNLVLSGPPGTIKTISILALMHELLGGPNCKEAFLELNALDDRYIFKKVKLTPRRHKIVILDEANRGVFMVHYVLEGLEAIIFIADGDMRQIVNNLQATYISDWHSFQIGGNWEEIFGPVLLMEVLFICLILSILMELTLVLKAPSTSIISDILH
ncbi:hypothetical protein JHK86_001509 [Glycine max]|nr:hypothetical protein JHK86_001509 [Glycine max]